MSSNTFFLYFKSTVTGTVPKDNIEKLDFQELIFAVVNWPNS